MDIKPSKKLRVLQKRDQPPREQTTFQKVATSEGTRTRTSALFHTIDQLKDNRGFADKMFDSLTQKLDTKTLSENFSKVKELFNQYEEFGIIIPQDILKNFELYDGTPILRPDYITDAPAEELKKLAVKGESLLQQKLDEREITYGPLQAKEIVANVLQEGDLTPQDIQNFLSISTSFRKLAKQRDRLVLTGSDLSKPDLH